MEQQILDEAIALSDARYDELQRLTRRIAELEALLTAPETHLKLTKKLYVQSTKNYFW